VEKIRIAGGYKIVFIILVAVALAVSSFGIPKIGKAESLTIENEGNDTNDLPEWAIGNKWIYDFNFDFTYSILDISGTINNMRLNVIDINEENDEYTLEITGNLDAQLSILDIIPGGSFTGDVEGIAHFEKSTLAIKDFVFECFGYYTIIETIAKVSMTFDPPFDFFDFPIESDEDENNPWSAETYAALDGNFKIGVIEYPFSTAGGFDGEELYVVNEESHTVNGQAFDCFLIRGSMGPSHSGSSNLWYSPDVGYLVDIQEIIYGWEGVDATLGMPLKYTNYIIDNDPPNIPDKPSGDTALTAGEEYTYTASTSDKEGDNIYYKFDWGDETFSEWLGPYNSGRSVSASHRWVQTGAYNLRVKAKDTTEVESLWSEPLSITVNSELPTVTVNVYEIERIDDIDYSYPWDTMGYLAEWYYRVEAISEGLVATDSYYHTHDHTKNGRWNHADYWKPNRDHELLTKNAEVVVTIKLMDHDEWYEFGHDLADVSGCNDDGADNEADKNIRGAIFCGTYNMATDELDPYSDNPDDYSDYRKIQDGHYVTCGDYKPDNSNNYDGNDALVRFWIYDSYTVPTVEIDYQPKNPRPGEDVQFMGKVTGGFSTDEYPYKWQWYLGDGAESDLQNPINQYSLPGDYTVTCILTDGFGQTDRVETTIHICDNQPPEIPIVPSGPSNVKAGETCTYTSITTDSEGDKIFYKFDWGDGSYSGWMGPYASGEMGSASHKWDNKGSYEIKVKAKDEHGDESDWSDPLSVRMPKNKQYINTPFLNFLQNFLENHPLIYQLLQRFLRL